jgi:2-keto-4-pentenoate hydratase/2-oxohepta-3-ene-1,7-dioic acid hydratase in catechol pathway
MRVQLFATREAVQEATPADMIFSVAALITYISRGIALEPAEIVATDTPPGVALGRLEARFLKDGDEVEIDSIGVLRNLVRGV